MQQAAVRYTTKCAAMGGKFIMWCEMTGRFKFLYIVVVRREIFRQLWERTRTWVLQTALENVGTLPEANASWGRASALQARGNVITKSKVSCRLSA